MGAMEGKQGIRNDIMQLPWQHSNRGKCGMWRVDEGDNEQWDSGIAIVIHSSLILLVYMFVLTRSHKYFKLSVHVGGE